MSSTDRHQSPDSQPTATDAEIVDVLPDLVLELSADGHYLAYHGGPDEDLYVEADELLGESISDVLPPSAADKIEAALQKTYEDGRPTTVSYILPGDHKLEFFECRLLPLDSGNRLALIRNMTDSWRAKTELEQSEARYRTLVNNLPGLVYRCHIDEPWNAIYVSPTVEDLFGFPPEEFTSEDRGLQSLIHPEDRQRVQQEVAAAVEQDCPFHLSYRMIDADGEVHYVSERGQAIYAEFDDAHYLDGVVFDVTDVHQMRQRLIVNTKMAAVGNLAAGVAHEINNPLAIAMANLEYVDEELAAVIEAVDDDPPVLDAIDDIDTAVTKIQYGIDRVHDIIEDLRTFTDAAESRADNIDMRRLVEWAVQRFNQRTDHRATIELDLDDVPDVWASEVGVVQIVWNLLENALEALERDGDDGGTISVRLTADGEDVRLEISDDGPGMSTKISQRACEPFFTTKEVGQGAGLGLFVCQGLVDGMDGTIDIDTAPGEGTTVSIRLPAYRPPQTTGGDPGPSTKTS